MGSEIEPEGVDHQLLNSLSDTDIDIATNVPVGMVRNWLQDESEPSGEDAERVNELIAVVDRLAALVDPDFISIWLRKPLRLLGGEKPLDAIRLGRYDDVSRVVASLEFPVTS